VKLEFESNLKFQLDVINSVTELFTSSSFIKLKEVIFSEVVNNRMS